MSKWTEVWTDKWRKEKMHSCVSSNKKKIKNNNHIAIKVESDIKLPCKGLEASFTNSLRVIKIAIVFVDEVNELVN